MNVNIKKECNRILNAIKQTPWAITQSSLESIIAIATRSYSEPNIAAAIQQQRHDNALFDVEAPLVAVINVFGPIFTRADFFSEVSGACTISQLKHQIDEAITDDSIKSIILNIDSPGGAVTGTHELAEHIKSVDKPIVAYVSGMACSAAYWLASATDKIYADKTAVLGSIGVVAMWTDDSEAKKKQGLVDYEIVSSQSPKKREDPTTDEGKLSLQKTIDGLADVFIDDVAQNRQVSTDTVLADFGQGGVFLATEAIAKGMADEISSLQGVVDSFNSTGDITMGNQNQPKGSSNKNKIGAQAEIDKEKEQQDALLDDDNGGEGDNQKPDNTQSRKASNNDDDISSDDEEEPAAENDENESDNEEEPKTHQALNRFAKSNPAMYGAIMRRGIRRERDRIAGIDELEIKGHDKLIQQAKYQTPMSVAHTALAIAKKEKSLRAKMADDYKADSAFNTARSSATQTTQATEELSALAEMAKGAKTITGGK